MRRHGLVRVAAFCMLRLERFESAAAFLCRKVFFFFDFVEWLNVNNND